MAALGALALAWLGCAAPVMHARTADVLDAGRARLRASTVVVAMARSTAVVEAGTDQVEPGEYSDLWSARHYRTRWVGVDTAFGPFFSAEAQGALSPFDGCEIGALLSLVRLGGEVRCGIVDEDRGAPFSAALSVGAAQQISYGIVALIIDGRPSDEYPHSHELRAGLDLSVRAEGVTPLFNINLGYVRQLRELQGNLPITEREEWSNDQGDIVVIRDELRLSLPIGAAFEQRMADEPGRVGRVILALVPELTLSAHNRDAPAFDGDERIVVRDFEQVWAVYVTVAGEGEW